MWSNIEFILSNGSFIKPKLVNQSIAELQFLVSMLDTNLPVPCKKIPSF